MSSPNAAGRCRSCRERAEHRCRCCATQTALTWFGGQWLCHRCALAIELDRHLGATELPAALVSLRDAIIAADNPSRVRKWLHGTTAGRLLRDLATGEVDLTHETLDGYGADRSVAHLRALLVAVCALPADDRRINRLEVLAAQLLDRVADHQDAKVVRAWLRWRVLRRLRARHEDGVSSAHSPSNARSALHCVVAFLENLHAHGRTLRTCTQDDLDTWFARRGATPWLARPFLVWAATRGHLPCPLTIPPAPQKALRPVLETEQRWVIARRLVTDGTMPVADRVAAALVVLYGQPLSRIATLKTTDIHRSPDGTVIVSLDGNPVPILAVRHSYRCAAPPAQPWRLRSDR